MQAQCHQSFPLPLLLFAACGDEATCQRLLRNPSVLLECHTHDGVTPLGLAASVGSMDRHRHSSHQRLTQPSPIDNLCKYLKAVCILRNTVAIAINILHTRPCCTAIFPHRDALPATLPATTAAAAPRSPDHTNTPTTARWTRKTCPQTLVSSLDLRPLPLPSIPQTVQSWACCWSWALTSAPVTAAAPAPSCWRLSRAIRKPSRSYSAASRCSLNIHSPLPCMHASMYPSVGTRACAVGASATSLPRTGALGASPG
eukprot:365898-Chlamydomonas_euryale.AAC.4